MKPYAEKKYGAKGYAKGGAATAYNDSTAIMPIQGRVAKRLALKRLKCLSMMQGHRKPL